jgi:hypothetical protein
MKSIALTLTLVMALGFAADAEAAKKKKNPQKQQLTGEQRKKAFNDAVKWCRKTYGSQMHFVRIENYYGRIVPVCYHY